MTTSTNCCDERLGGRRVELAVEGDDAAERGGGIGGVRLAVGFRQVSSATAAPQGLACLTMTHAGWAKLFTHSHAASASAMLL